jgi:hypothetical protein
MGMHLICMHLIGVYFIDVHLVGMHLIGVNLVSVYIDSNRVMVEMSQNQMVTIGKWKFQIASSRLGSKFSVPPQPIANWFNLQSPVQPRVLKISRHPYLDFLRLLWPIPWYFSCPLPLSSPQHLSDDGC